MREIKFRVWDLKNKLFKIPSIGRIEGTMFVLSKEGVLFSSVENENFVIQTFTGLKDKNGKEIYEGDILKEHRFEDWGDEEGFEYVGVVRYRTYSNDAGNQFSGFVTYPNLRENKGYAGNLIKVDCEVIGNIFENTDLLK